MRDEGFCNIVGVVIERGKGWFDRNMNFMYRSEPTQAMRELVTDLLIPTSSGSSVVS